MASIRVSSSRSMRYNVGFSFRRVSSLRFCSTSSGLSDISSLISIVISDSFSVEDNLDIKSSNFFLRYSLVIDLFLV